MGGPQVIERSRLRHGLTPSASPGWGGSLLVPDAGVGSIALHARDGRGGFRGEPFGRRARGLVEKVGLGIEEEARDRSSSCRRFGGGRLDVAICFGDLGFGRHCVRRGWADSGGWADSRGGCHGRCLPRGRCGRGRNLSGRRRGNGGCWRRTGRFRCPCLLLARRTNHDGARAEHEADRGDGRGAEFVLIEKIEEERQPANREGEHRRAGEDRRGRHRKGLAAECHSAFGGAIVCGSYRAVTV
jgi:hypothetical protein